jgi:hypothetical protein
MRQSATWISYRLSVAGGQAASSIHLLRIRYGSSGLDTYTMFWLRRLLACWRERVHVLRDDADLQVFLCPDLAWLGGGGTDREFPA